MGETIIFEKVVDKSALYDGIAIPLAYQDTVYQQLGHRLARGETQRIVLIVRGEKYPAFLYHPPLTQANDTSQDKLQIRYSHSSLVAVALRSIFASTADKVSAHISTGAPSRLQIESSEREYMRLCSTPDLGSFLLDIVRVHPFETQAKLARKEIGTQVATEEKSANDPTILYFIQKRIRQCPFCETDLEPILTPILDTDGKTKKMQVRQCTRCHRLYVLRNVYEQIARSSSLNVKLISDLLGGTEKAIAQPSIRTSLPLADEIAKNVEYRVTYVGKSFSSHAFEDILVYICNRMIEVHPAEIYQLTRVPILPATDATFFKQEKPSSGVPRHLDNNTWLLTGYSLKTQVDMILGILAHCGVNTRVLSITERFNGSEYLPMELYYKRIETARKEVADENIVYSPQQSNVNHSIASQQRSPVSDQGAQHTSYSEMDVKRKGLIIAYYFSRCSADACDRLGFTTLSDAFASVGEIIGEKPSNIKNMRDEFDPYFNNGRRGWYQRTLAPSRKEIFDEFECYSDEELLSVVRQILEHQSNKLPPLEGCILKDLGALIRQTAARYKSEYVWQDVELTDDFKREFADYLRKNNYSIEFFTHTAVITSSSTKDIFLPNQWFVIAAYAVGAYLELMKYKGLFMRVAEALDFKPDDYAKSLKIDAQNSDRELFFRTCESLFTKDTITAECYRTMTQRLWRFATDYAWWSGQKTIDRGDFHYSVILNMLNLVNASQSYVGDIVTAYGSYSALSDMTMSLESFTKNMRGITYDFIIESESEFADFTSTASPIGQDGNAGKHKIVISTSSIKRLVTKV